MTKTIGEAIEREATIASAATCDIGNATTLNASSLSIKPLRVAITGSAPISSFGTQAYKIRILRFTGALTLNASASLVLAGGASSYLTSAGAMGLAVSDNAGVWAYQPFSGGGAGSTVLVADTTPISGGTIGNILFHKTGNVLGELTAVNNVPIGNVTPSTGAFTSPVNVFGATDSYLSFYSASSQKWLVGHDTVAGGKFIIYELAAGYRLTISPTSGNVALQSTSASTTPTTGALTVAGGVGIGTDLTVGGGAGFAGAAPNSQPGNANTNVGISNYPDGLLFVSRANQPGASFNINVNGVLVQCMRSGTAVGSITVTTTGTNFNTSSDGRLKEDVRALSTAEVGSIIDDTEVYDFKWKETGERAFGVIAQQAAQVYATPMTHDKEKDRWFVDYSKYVPVILRELQALRARVAQLEAGMAGKPT